MTPRTASTAAPAFQPGPFMAMAMFAGDRVQRPVQIKAEKTGDRPTILVRRRRRLARRDAH